MSAMHTNDTLTAMMVTLTVYLVFVAAEKGFPTRTLVILAISAALTLITKITALVIFPSVIAMALIAFLLGGIGSGRGSGRFAPLKLLIALVPAFIVLALQMNYNMERYEKPLLNNFDMLEIQAKNNPTKVFILSDRPGKGNISFTDFKPFSAISEPLVTPKTIGSFWTLVYARMWWDYRPKMLYLDKANVTSQEWWDSYSAYLLGRSDHWPGSGGIGAFTRFTGSALILLGLFLTFLIALGALLSLLGGITFRAPPVSEEVSSGGHEAGGRRGAFALLLALVVLFAANAAGIIWATTQYPIVDSMKATYFLNSIAPLTVFFAVGAGFFEKRSPLRLLISANLALLFVAVAFHIISLSIGPIAYQAALIF